MSDGPQSKKRLGHYDYNREENPLPDDERKWRDLQRQKLFRKYAQEKKKRQAEYVKLDPSRLGGQFSAVFAQLSGNEQADVSNSSPEEVEGHSKKLNADIKWLDALRKELCKERDFFVELHRWMLNDNKPPLQDPPVKGDSSNGAENNREEKGGKN